jgi:tetratricopeptide (TPR) repeat protein
VVTADMLAAMLGAPAAEVDLHLRLGCASGLLVQTGAVLKGDTRVGEGEATSSTAASVAFRHALVQEVVAAALTRPRRKLLHQAAFTALVARLGDRATERASVLAHHAYQGGFWMDAARFSAAAMVRSVARSANRDALRMLDTGLDAARRVDDEPTQLACELVLRSEALGALWPLGHFDAMFVHLERAQAITEQMGDPKRQAAVSLQMAGLFWVRGKAGQGLAAAQAAKSAALWAGNRGAQMTAAQLELMLHHGLGRYADVVQQARDVERDFAVELSRRRIMPGWATLPSVNVKVFLADALARMGDKAAAQAVCDTAYRELQAQDHAFSRTLVDFAQTSLWLRQGLHAQAIPHLRETLVSCHQHDIHTMTPCIVGLLAEALGLAGEVGEAQAMVEQTLADKSYLLAGLYGEFYLRYGWGVACATAQRHAQALAQFSAAQAHAARYEQWGHEADALLAMGAVAASAGDTSAALVHLEAARATAQACGMRGVAQRAQARTEQLLNPVKVVPVNELAND